MFKTLAVKSLDFIVAGVACNCITALYEAGLIRKLEKRNYLKKSDIDNCSNPICMHSALVTLERAGIFKEEGRSYRLTPFGMEVLEYLGLITIFFDGYGQLVSRQGDIVKKRLKNVSSLIKGESVSRASRFISDKTVHPILLEVFSHLKFKGTICDLGCGYGDLLTKICHKTGNPGLGFDSQPLVVKRANRKTLSNITIEKANIANLKGVWEDVVILMQSFVFHDFTPSSKCIKLMNSYLKNFPNLRYFFYVDIVSPSSDHHEIFPGFDYVHGLLGVKTRTYEETIEMFEKSNFAIAKEVKIDKLPNTYLWVLDVNR
jgi:hypothetical protein